MSSVLKLLSLLILLQLSFAAHAFEKIKLIAIFAGKAIVEIDDTQRVLVVNQKSPEGVMLVASDTKNETATIEFEGKHSELRLAAVIQQSDQDASLSMVNLWANHDGFFYADGSINDYPVRFLVDTGANTIALSSREAKRIGLHYNKKNRGMVSTASGVAAAYRLQLDEVKVGSIALNNIDAVIIEGTHPKEVLLGMSFLQRLDMHRKGDRLELKKRY